jgi:hypothetical protein
MICPNPTSSKLWHQKLNKDFGGHDVTDWLISLCIKSSAESTVFYTWANSGLIVFVTYPPTFWGTVLTLHFMWKTKKASPPCVTICLSSYSFAFHMAELAVWGIIRVLFQMEKNQIKPSVPGCSLCDYEHNTVLTVGCQHEQTLLLWKDEHSFWPNNYLTLGTIIFLQVAHYYLTH